DRNRSHWSTSKTPSYTKSVSWQHHPNKHLISYIILMLSPVIFSGDINWRLFEHSVSFYTQ
ncbi:hypothetical protein, partial [Citrobacter freundii]|uniref:hypothetical protein n=1 Tax=Citrobacter freundii TaxID=546 RepID=UPI00214DB84E